MKGKNTLKREEREYISRQLEKSILKLKPTERKLLAFIIQEARRQEKERLLEQHPELKELQKTMDNEMFDFILDVLITKDIDYIYETLEPMITDEEIHKEFQKYYEECKRHNE